MEELISKLRKNELTDNEPVRGCGITFSPIERTSIRVI